MLLMSGPVVNYSIQIDTISPFKPQFISDITTTEHKENFNNGGITENYFKNDSFHDLLHYDGTPEDTVIKQTHLHYPSRFDNLNFMTISKVDRDILEKDGPTEQNITTIQVNKIINGDPIQMSLKKYFEDILQINISDQPHPKSITSCKKDISVGGLTETTQPSFYELMQFFNIHDTGTKFPDDISSPSFIIDSASNANTLHTIPNICKKKTNGIYDISEFILPSDPGYNTESNTNVSLLFYGDLQIAHYFNTHLLLGQIVDNPDNNGITIQQDIINKFSITAADTAKVKKFLHYSVIAINIFWQYVLSYVTLYTDLYDKKTDRNLKETIIILRHWVFTTIEIAGDATVTQFKGSFHNNLCKPIHDYNVKKIANWFLINHNPVAENTFTIPHQLVTPVTPVTHVFNATQSQCANLIGMVLNVIPFGLISHAKGEARNTNSEFIGIVSIINKYWEDYSGGTEPITATTIALASTTITAAATATATATAAATLAAAVKLATTLETAKRVVNLCQLLKFTGDKSHQTASILLKTVFASRTNFKNMRGCVTTIDRPLIIGCLLDNIPLIITGGYTQIIKVMKLKGCDNLDKHTQVIGWFIPKTDLNIYDIVKNCFRNIEKFIKMLTNLYAPRNIFIKDFISFQFNHAKHVIIKKIHETFVYICLVYLSFFTCIR